MENPFVQTVGVELSQKNMQIGEGGQDLVVCYRN